MRFLAGTRTSKNSKILLLLINELLQMVNNSKVKSVYVVLTLDMYA